MEGIREEEEGDVEGRGEGEVVIGGSLAESMHRLQIRRKERILILIIVVRV